MKLATRPGKEFLHWMRFDDVVGGVTFTGSLAIAIMYGNTLVAHFIHNVCFRSFANVSAEYPLAE